MNQTLKIAQRNKNTDAETVTELVNDGEQLSLKERQRFSVFVVRFLDVGYHLALAHVDLLRSDSRRKLDCRRFLSF